jgi:hypothetical protein
MTIAVLNFKSAVPGIALVALGVAMAGCSAAAPDTGPVAMTPALIQRLQAQGTTPGSVTPDMLRPDGLMKNGLLPEQWGDTS